MLQIEKYLEVFEREEIQLKDFYLLKREDLVEMQIPIGIRNRILKFVKVYKAN